MQIPVNPSNNDIRDALLQLAEDNRDIRNALTQLDTKVEQLDTKVEQLDSKVDKSDYKFEMYQRGTDGMVRMATTIIIATASVVVLSSLSPAIATIVSAFNTK